MMNIQVIWETLFIRLALEQFFVVVFFGGGANLLPSMGR